MRRARYLGVSRASFGGGPRRLTYGEEGFVNESDERGLQFIQPSSGDIWVVDRYEIEFLPEKSAIDWPSKVVLVVLGIAVCSGLAFAAVMLGWWLS